MHKNLGKYLICSILSLLVVSQVVLAQQEQVTDPQRISCEASPEQVMGPFYPIHEQEDKDVNLTRIKGINPTQTFDPEAIADGEIIYVKGQVLNQRCEPIFGATVEIWQTNSKGKYMHERDFNPAPLDPNFQGWGKAITDKEGSYAFRTIKPAPYPLDALDPELNEKRTPHIHFKVTRQGFHELITQMYFANEPLNQTDILTQMLSPEELSRVTIAPQTLPEKQIDVFEFDLVLKEVQRGAVAAYILDDYIGKYQLGMETLFAMDMLEPLVLTITREGYQLFAESAMQPKAEIIHVEGATFKFPALGTTLEFHRNHQGQVNSLSMSGGFDESEVIGIKLY